MPQRARKLIGTIVLVAFVCFYAMTVMTIAAAKLQGASHLAELLYFLVAGLIWIVPAAGLIYWMAKPDRPVT